MAGAMRKLGLYLGLVEDDEERGRYDGDNYAGHDDQYDAYGERGSGESVTAMRRSASDAGSRTAPSRRGEDRATTRGSLAVDPGLRAVSHPAAQAAEEDGAPYRITTLHPRTYNEARQIGEHFRDGTPVIMNLTEMDDVDAKRLVDFAAGLIFGLHGSIERITNKVFLLTPANVDVTAEDKARIAEGGFFNQS